MILIGIYLMYNGSNDNTAHYDLVVATTESSRASALSGMQAGSAETDSVSHFDSALQSIFRPQDETVLNLIKKLAETQHERLVREGKTKKKSWTEKDMIKNKNKKPAFIGGKGVLGETANIGGHMSLAPTTTTTTTTTTAPKPTATTTTAPVTTTATTATAPAAAVSKTSWACEVCTYTNAAARSRCEMCDNPKPKNAAVAVAAAAPAPVQQQPVVQQQPKPVQVQPAAVVQQPKPVTQTPAPVTTQQPVAKPIAVQQPVAKPTASSSTPTNRPWTCSSCTYSNRPSAQACEMCDVPRSGGGGGAVTVPAKNNNPSPSDVLSRPPNNDKHDTNNNNNKKDDKNEEWDCTSCHHSNAPGTTKCSKCNTKKADCNIM